MNLFKNHPWWTWPLGLFLAYAVGRFSGVPTDLAWAVAASTVLWVFLATVIPEFFK